ncbi:hypothetical protein EYF80_033812 [Liparis tanakae]|uniref:Uncharacterized protein n=1 Tax=Liparis tanakae TaxID=230148 RepID=A0A4Z2GQY2_9TELE|nr:hypothetical protein EYF80_033812 [Liparis tanakae]
MEIEEQVEQVEQVDQGTWELEEERPCSAAVSDDAVNAPPNRVGGRTLSTEIPAANGVDRWDFGGQWVGRHFVSFSVLATSFNQTSETEQS